MKYLKYEPHILVVSYEELEDIVQAHKDGDSEATDKLIGAFWKYMQKYVRLVSSGKTDITDRKIRQFIKLFMSKEESATAHMFRKNRKAQQDLLQASEAIHYLFQHSSYEELLNEAILALLIVADRYKSEGNFFHTYVSRVFCFQYYRQLQQLLLLNTPTNCLPYFDEEYADDLGEYTEGILEDTRFLINEPLDEINENWINGLTAGDIFEDLTPTQRRILKLHYEDDLKDEDIADIMGVCRATINRRRLATVKTIQGQLQNLNWIKEK